MRHADLAECMQNMRQSHIDIKLTCLKYREKNWCDVAFLEILEKRLTRHSQFQLPQFTHLCPL